MAWYAASGRPNEYRSKVHRTVVSSAHSSADDLRELHEHGEVTQPIDEVGVRSRHDRLVGRGHRSELYLSERPEAVQALQRLDRDARMPGGEEDGGSVASTD